MIRHSNYIFIIILTLLSSALSAQKFKSYNDGPYIKIKDGRTELSWIKNGRHKTEEGVTNDTSIFNVSGLPEVNLSELDFDRDLPTEYDNVSKFLAISDIHGQHDLFIKILVSHNVIDTTGVWTYGDGHLMIVGDIFDRGDKVTESLWFLFDLEKQAKRNGGHVHILLGNHELMVLHGDVRYINPKYQYTAGKLKVEYEELFSNETVLGQWLRSKNITEKINDIVFVHGGFSKQVLDKEKSLIKINDIFKQQITSKKKIKSNNSKLIDLLYFENGPLWYRGYANPNGFDVEVADDILDLLDAETIVVGHTSMPKIITLHDNKIILIDSSIKFGSTGEVLIMQNDTLYRGMDDGTKVVLGDDKDKGFGSPFNYVYNLGDGDLTIILNTDIKKLLKNKLKEEYQDSKLTAVHNNEFNRVWNIKLRSRGNMRKKICELPPLKLNFPKSTLRYLGFDGYDKLKLVIPCDDSKYAQEGNYKEEVVYRLYEIIDSIALRTRQVNIVLQDKKKTKYDFNGFFVEDEHDFSSRTGAKIINEGIIMGPGTQRESYLKLVFFQYMICNTDWSYYSKHNLKLIHLPGEKRTRAVPHDFDYAGIVGMDYAVPHDKMPIHDVWQPFFRGKNVTAEEVKMMAQFYNSKKERIYATINDDKYLSDKSKKQMTKFIDRFYETLDNEKQWHSKLINPKSLNSNKK